MSISVLRGLSWGITNLKICNPFYTSKKHLFRFVVFMVIKTKSMIFWFQPKNVFEKYAKFPERTCIRFCWEYTSANFGFLRFLKKE